MSKALATKNVAAVLLSVALTLGIVFSFASPAKAQTLESLQAQIQQLLAQIAALQAGSSTNVGSMQCATTFTQNLRQGASGGQVMALQQFLNSMSDTQVSATGAGSPGNETSFFGPATRAAVVKFQNKYAAQVLTPVGLSTGTGYWGPSSRAQANALCAGAPAQPGTPGTPITGNVSVMASAQPTNSLAPANAARVPFTNFTVSNGTNAAVTINSVTVQRTGFAANSNFSGVVLVNAGTGEQIGIARTLGSNNQANIGDSMTLQPGQSVMLTVAGNIAAAPNAGEVASFSVVGVNTSAPVAGALPIVGASHTMNSTLSIGTVVMSVGPSDPNASANREIGTMNYTFASVRAQAGSGEDIWLKSVRFNQTGSASSADLNNVHVVIDGTSYPATISADGKYYTAMFAGNGIQILKGNQKEILVRGDIISGTGRTITFDIHRNTDVNAVGGTYGFGITASQTQNGTAGTTNSMFTSGTPFYSGPQVTVSAGSVTSITNASEVTSQNILGATANQTLGGFAVDAKGEPINVQGMVFTIATGTTGSIPSAITSVVIVNASGAVVAGPVDATVNSAASTQTVTFTDSVTFPIGRNVYTLQGRLPSGTTNGLTIVASTNPNTGWSNVTGQTTGDTITLTQTSFSLSTMTVRSGAIVGSVSPTPAAQTVVAGAQNLHVATIRYDAALSGEDVRFSSSRLDWTASAGADDGEITNCHAWDGSTRLNDTAVNPTTGAPTNYTFLFNTNLVVPKGTVKEVQIRCSISASTAAGQTFRWGVDTNMDTTTGTGVTSGQTVTPTATGNQGNTMTVSAGGALTVTADSSAPGFALAAGGTTGVAGNAFRFTGTNEAVNINEIGLALPNTAADVTSATIHKADGTQIGSVIFTGNNTIATTTLSEAVNVPANGNATVLIRVNVASVGTGQSGTGGAIIDVDFSGARGTGVSSGNTVWATGTAAANGIRLERTYPTVALVDLATTGVADGELIKFTVSAHSNRDVGLGELNFNVATTSNVAVTDMFLYAYTAGGAPVAAAPGGQLNSAAANVVGSVVTITPNNVGGGGNVLHVPAGQTYTFLLRGTVAVTGSNVSVTTRLLGDTSTTNAGAIADLNTGNFAWSPNSTTTVTSTSNDFRNAVAVPGLPSSGIAETRSQ